MAPPTSQYGDSHPCTPFAVWTSDSNPDPYRNARKINEKMRKLREIILLHFGLVAFRFHYGRDRTSIICMIWGFSDVSMTPKSNAFYFWRHQDASNNPRKAHYVGHLKVLNIEHFGIVGKDGHRKIMKIRLTISWKS